MTETAGATTDQTSTMKARALGALRWALVVLSVVLVTLGALAGWIRTQLLDTDAWERTSRATIQEPAVQEALGEYVGDSIVDAVGAEQLLADALPPRLQPAAPALASLAESTTRDLVNDAVEGPRVEEAWVGANVAAHERLRRVVEGDETIVNATAEGIELDLATVVERVAGRVGLEGDRVDRVVAGIEPLRVKDSEGAAAAIRLVRLFDTWSPIIAPLGLLALVGALALAPPASRRRLLQGWAIGLVVGGVILLRATPAIGSAVAGVLVEVTIWERAVLATWVQVTAQLVLAARLLATVGIVVLAGAWLGGPSTTATHIRAAVAPRLASWLVPARVALGGLWLLALTNLPMLARLEPLGAVLLTILAGAGWYLLERELLRSTPTPART